MTIELCNPSACTGCGLCAAICQKSAIVMVADPNGFSYPKLKPDICIECEKCRNACPVLSYDETDTQSVPETFACWAKDTGLRKCSSSGGLFSVFAEQVLEKKGAVYGVVFDSDLKTVFSRADTPEDLAPMRGSKYIEANTDNLFSRIAADLRQGLQVLFSGTPCQNAALKNFVTSLGLPTSSLYQIDFLCHGVSSPALWESFVHAVESKYRDKLRCVYFRDKSIGGWKSPAIRLVFEHRKDIIISWSTVRLHLENAFITCYHKNLSHRHACAQCRWAGLPRQGDITLADAQKLYHHPDFHEESRNGISMILLNTPKARNLFAKSAQHIISRPRPFAEMRLPALPITLHPLHGIFLDDAQHIDFFELLKKHRRLLSPPLHAGTVLNGILKSLLGAKFALSIRETIESVFGCLLRRKQ